MGPRLRATITRMRSSISERRAGALGQEGVSAIGPLEGFDASADEDRRHLRSQLLHAANKLVAIHARHDEIAQDQVDASFTEQLQRPLAVKRDQNTITAGFQHKFTN